LSCAVRNSTFLSSSFRHFSSCLLEFFFRVVVGGTSHDVYCCPSEGTVSYCGVKFSRSRWCVAVTVKGRLSPLDSQKRWRQLLSRLEEAALRWRCCCCCCCHYSFFFFSARVCVPAAPNAIAELSTAFSIPLVLYHRPIRLHAPADLRPGDLSPLRRRLDASVRSRVRTAAGAAEP
jgi:hypothetical protein